MERSDAVPGSEDPSERRHETRPPTRHRKPWAGPQGAQNTIVARWLRWAALAAQEAIHTTARRKALHLGTVEWNDDATEPGAWRAVCRTTRARRHH